MGLDMYLNKTIKIPRLSAPQIDEINERICCMEVSEAKALDFEEIVPIEGANKLKEVVHTRESKVISPWSTVYEQVGYWRKANHIHQWFVDYVQGGEDECEPHYVSEKQLELLEKVCKKVINNPDLGPELLPVQSGFFFGGTEYDEYYMETTQYTLKIVSGLLKSTNFQKERLIYHSSW